MKLTLRMLPAVGKKLSVFLVVRLGINTARLPAAGSQRGALMPCTNIQGNHVLRHLHLTTQLVGSSPRRTTTTVSATKTESVMMSSEEYEVVYTVRSELAKKGISPGVFGGPVGFGPGGCGPWGPRQWGVGPGPWGYGGRGHRVQHWMKDATPAEMGVLMKYRDQVRQRAVIGGLVGASAMAGVAKAAALGGFLGVAGMIVGGAIGTRVSVRTSGIRYDMMSEIIRLPGERSPRAAHAREILRTKLPHNAFAQELLKESAQ